MTKSDQDKLVRLFETEHPEYGVLGMIKLIDDERYCFFVKGIVVTMIPLEMV